MPQTELLLYQDEHGNVPLLNWLDKLSDKALAKCRVKLERLAQLGHELRRPEADLLRDGIYELRVGIGGINYRMLYYFHGRQAVVVSHGLTKERRVPPKEIDLAIRRKTAFEAEPEKHTYREE